MKPAPNDLANRSATALLLSIATFHASWITGTILAVIGIILWVISIGTDAKQEAAINLRKDELKIMKIKAKSLALQGIPALEADKIISEESAEMWRKLKMKPPVIAE